MLRRFDDAVCAFATGHSRRDLDRVRRRRMRLLGQRLVGNLSGDVDHYLSVVERWPDYEEGKKLLCQRQDELKTASDLVDEVLHGRHRSVAPVLLEMLVVDRFVREATRVLRRSQIDPVDGADDDRLEAGSIALVAPNIRYCQFYEGLLQYSVLHAFHYKLGVGVRHLRTFLGDVRRELFDWSSYSFASAVVKTSEPRGPPGMK